ncbi:hypothetical protein ACFU5O_08655 [Streptomyces sp. NPDC057445]|uniref:hypothetical protein n=1 Tax=Streptomyces sp. NPDC057445 TaxID=3346136 RepID=UPI0036CBBD7C
MISEPELVGGGEFSAPATADTVVAGGDEEPNTPRPGRSWLWALGGAVVASAVWAGGLYVYERLGPDLGGYRASAELCQDAEFKAMTAALGKRAEGWAQADEHRAVDRSVCGADFGTDRDAQYSVLVHYELHKETDPQPDFESRARPTEVGEEREGEWIKGLGERAYLVMPESDGDSLELMVLDGRATFALSVSAQYAYSEDELEAEEPPAVDVTPARGPLIEDMKALLARLKRPA